MKRAACDAFICGDTRIFSNVCWCTWPRSTWGWSCASFWVGGHLEAYRVTLRLSFQTFCGCCARSGLQPWLGELMPPLLNPSGPLSRSIDQARRAGQPGSPISFLWELRATHRRPCPMRGRRLRPARPSRRWSRRRRRSMPLRSRGPRPRRTMELESSSPRCRAIAGVSPAQRDAILAQVASIKTL